MFVDEVKIYVEGGKGGAGMVGWRREKFVAFGGPDGGDGGRGGSVVFEAHEGINTLMDLRYQKHIRAEHGKPGQGSRKHGRSGRDMVLRVPVGTQVFDMETGELVGDLVDHGQTLTAAAGGLGGQGNARFATSTNRTPRYAGPGLPGEKRQLRLELKLLADAGLVGYPSVGKSTLISALSNARPKIASYPFTTLVPNLGVVEWKSAIRFVVADIPGLIEGASEGMGLGHQFLRHVERCRVLIHVLEVPPPFEYEDGMMDWTDRDPIEDFKRLCVELEKWNPELAQRDDIVVLNKMDMEYTQEKEEELRAYFEGLGKTFVAVSAAARQGLDTLCDEIGRRVVAYREKQEAEREERKKLEAASHPLLAGELGEEAKRAVERGEGASGQGRHTEHQAGEEDA